jgi:hypothetical protein
VRTHIVNTADDIDGLNPGLEGQLGSGRINAAQAVARAIQMPPGSGLEATSARVARHSPSLTTQIWSKYWARCFKVGGGLDDEVVMDHPDMVPKPNTGGPSP